MTAKAQEQSRIAQTMSVEASATKRESAEAQRRAEIARGADQDLLVRSTAPVITATHLRVFPSCIINLHG